MQIDFTGRNIELTDALKNTATEKLQKLTKRSEKMTRLHVTFHVDKLDQIAEANLHVNGTELHAKGVATDMYSAIDQLLDHLTTQLTKLKDKIK